MRARATLITYFILLITFELINAASTNSTNKNKLPKKAKRFMQDDESPQETDSTEIISTTEAVDTIRQTQQNIDPIEIKENVLFDYKLCKEVLKPSTAFTVILMIYMVLIIVGGILVLVLLKKDLEK